MSRLFPLLGAIGALTMYQGIIFGGSAPISGGRAVGVREKSWQRVILVGALSVALGRVTTDWILALVLGVLGIYLCLSIPASRERRRRRVLQQAWPDALTQLIARVRAGMALPEACCDLAVQGTSCLRTGWAAFATTYRAGGDFERALRALTDELRDPIGDRVALYLALTAELGGSELLNLLVSSNEQIRRDLQTRREIEARWSWTVTAARFASVAPWIVLALMLTRPEAATAYATPAGATVIATGIAATILGYRLMLRAGRLPEPGRLIE